MNKTIQTHSLNVRAKTRTDVFAKEIYTNNVIVGNAAIYKSFNSKQINVNQVDGSLVTNIVVGMYRGFKNPFAPTYPTDVVEPELPLQPLVPLTEYKPPVVINTPIIITPTPTTTPLPGITQPPATTPPVTRPPVPTPTTPPSTTPPLPTFPPPNSTISASLTLTQTIIVDTPAYTPPPQDPPLNPGISIDGAGDLPIRTADGESDIKSICNSTPLNSIDVNAGYYCAPVRPHIPEDTFTAYKTEKQMREASTNRVYDPAMVPGSPPVGEAIKSVRNRIYGGSVLSDGNGTSVASNDKKLENVLQCYSFNESGKSEVIEQCCIRVPSMYIPDLGVDTTNKTSLKETLANPSLQVANKKWRMLWNASTDDLTRSAGQQWRLWQAKFGKANVDGFDFTNPIANDFKNECAKLIDNYTYYDADLGTTVTDPDETGLQLYDTLINETCVCAPPITQIDSQYFETVTYNINYQAAVTQKQTRETFLEIYGGEIGNVEDPDEDPDFVVDEFGDKRPRAYKTYTRQQEHKLLAEKEANFGGNDIGRLGGNAIIHEYVGGEWVAKDKNWSPNIGENGDSQWTNEFQVCYYTDTLSAVESKCWQSGLFFARESCKQHLTDFSNGVVRPGGFLKSGTIEPNDSFLKEGRFDKEDALAQARITAYLQYLDCMLPLLPNGDAIIADLQARFLPKCESGENDVTNSSFPFCTDAKSTGASIGIDVAGGDGSPVDGDFDGDGDVDSNDYVKRAISLIKKRNIKVDRGGPFVTIVPRNQDWVFPDQPAPVSGEPPNQPTVDPDGTPKFPGGGGGGGGGSGSKTPAGPVDDKHLSNCPPASGITTDLTPRENKTYTRKNVYYPMLSGWTDFSRTIEDCITYTLIVVKKHPCVADGAWKLGYDKDQFLYFYVIHNGDPYAVGNQISTIPPIASPTGWVVSIEHVDNIPELYSSNGSDQKISIKEGKITSNTYVPTNHGLKSALEYEGGHAANINPGINWGAGTYYGFYNDGVYDCTGQKIKLDCLAIAYVDNQPFVYGNFFGAVPAQGNLTPQYTTEGKVLGGQIERSPSCFSECREIDGVCYCFNQAITNEKHPSAIRCEQKHGGDYGFGVEYDCYCQPIKLLTTPTIGGAFANEFACRTSTISPEQQQAQSECEANGGCWSTFAGNCKCVTQFDQAQECRSRGLCLKDNWCRNPNFCQECGCPCVDESTGKCKPSCYSQDLCPNPFDPCTCVDFTELTQECAQRFECATGCDCLDYTIMETECTERGYDEERILCVDPNKPCDCIAIEEMKDACKTAFDTCAWPETQLGDGSPAQCGCLSESDFKNACMLAGILDGGEIRCPNPNDACSCISWEEAAEGCTECKPLPTECGCRTRSDADDYCASIFKCINPDTENKSCDCFDKGKVPCPGGCNVPNTCICLSEEEMNTQKTACSANPSKIWKDCACVDDPNACECSPPPEHAEDDCWTKSQWATYCHNAGNCPASQYNTNVGGGYGGGNGCECAGTPQEIQENCTECYGGEESPCSCFTAEQIAESCAASNVCVNPNNSCKCEEDGNTPWCLFGTCLAGCDCVPDNSSYCGDETPCYLPSCKCYDQLDYCGELGMCSKDDGTCDCNDIPTNSDCAQYANTPCGGECDCRDTYTFKNDCEYGGNIAGEDCECFSPEECEANCNLCTECCYKCKCKTYAEMKSTCEEKNKEVNPNNKCDCVDNAADECKKTGSCLRTYLDENGLEASECVSPSEYCEKIGEVYCTNKEACTCVEPCDDDECGRKDACNDCVETLPECNGTWHTGDYTCTCPVTIAAGNCGCCQEAANTSSISPCNFNGSDHVKDQACTWTCGDESFSGKITAELGGDACKAAWVNCNCCNSTTCSSDCTQ